MRDHMKKLLICASLLLSTSAFAQAPDTPITLKLPLSDINAMLTIIAEAPRPWKETNPLIVKIQQQAQEQVNPKMSKAPDEGPPNKPVE